MADITIKTDLDDMLQNQNPKSFWYSVIYDVNQKQRIHWSGWIFIGSWISQIYKIGSTDLHVSMIKD